jgi:hypothetical protein
VRDIRHEDANMRIINALLDEILKETKYVETQIKESLPPVAVAIFGDESTSQRLGWVEMADLLEIAFLQVCSPPLLYHLPPTSLTD